MRPLVLLAALASPALAGSASVPPRPHVDHLLAGGRFEAGAFSLVPPGEWTLEKVTDDGIAAFVSWRPAWSEHWTSFSVSYCYGCSVSLASDAAAKKHIASTGWNDGVKSTCAPKPVRAGPERAYQCTYPDHKGLRQMATVLVAKQQLVLFCSMDVEAAEKVLPLCKAAISSLRFTPQRPFARPPADGKEL